jgi:hypothetical protein
VDPGRRVESRDQAKTLYTQAKGFVDDTPGLAAGSGASTATARSAR